jgi:hypothetical protein
MLWPCQTRITSKPKNKDKRLSKPAHLPKSIRTNHFNRLKNHTRVLEKINAE